MSYPSPPIPNDGFVWNLVVTWFNHYSTTSYHIVSINSPHFDERHFFQVNPLVFLLKPPCLVVSPPRFSLFRMPRLRFDPTAGRRPWHLCAAHPLQPPESRPETRVCHWGKRLFIWQLIGWEWCVSACHATYYILVSFLSVLPTWGSLYTMMVHDMVISHCADYQIDPNRVLLNHKGTKQKRCTHRNVNKRTYHCYHCIIISPMFMGSSIF